MRITSFQLRWMFCDILVVLHFIWVVSLQNFNNCPEIHVHVTVYTFLFIHVSQHIRCSLFITILALICLIIRCGKCRYVGGINHLHAHVSLYMLYQLSVLSVLWYIMYGNNSFHFLVHILTLNSLNLTNLLYIDRIE